MTLDIILFKKNQNFYILLPFSLFDCFLPSLTNKWPHTTLLMFEKCILRAKTWLDSFDSVSWKVSMNSNFCFLFFVVLFSRLKKLIRTGPNALL